MIIFTPLILELSQGTALPSDFSEKNYILQSVRDQVKVKARTRESSEKILRYKTETRKII